MAAHPPSDGTAHGSFELKPEIHIHINENRTDPCEELSTSVGLQVEMLAFPD
jgi:hypothetical protein